MKITEITALEILDSRGNPTVEATVRTASGAVGRAAVPSGASTGSKEALELRDGDAKRYNGKGVKDAVKHIEEDISPALLGVSVDEQEQIDRTMLELDGTEHKEKLGANAMLAVSMASTRAAATAHKMPLYAYVTKLFGNASYLQPVPMMNLLNGGKHAMGASDIQEYMIMPYGAPSIDIAIQWGAEVFHTLGKMLKKNGFQTTVGDEGGYAPALGSNEEPLKYLVDAIGQAGFQPGKDIGIAMDPAASEFYEDGTYVLKADKKELSSEELVELYASWVEQYPIVSIEDSHHEDDWDGFVAMTKKLGEKVQIVGDDLFVTNQTLLEEGIKKQAANAILIKLNQIGTVSETIATMQMANEHGVHSVVSHRSGETEDAFIADFVVGAGTGQIKTGSLSRSDRVAKYNQLLRIHAENEGSIEIASFPFKKGA